MTIGEKLAETNPEIESVSVKVYEYCNDDHPPASKAWTYNQSWDVDREVLGKLHHDKTSLRTASF